MPEFSCTIEETLPQGLRLDRYVAEYLGLLSRSQIKARSLTAAINGKEAKLSRPVQQGDRVELAWKEAEPLNIIPENIPLNIIYEDDEAVVVNKTQGMVVHPGAGNHRGTLANALYYRRLARNGLLPLAHNVIADNAAAENDAAPVERPPGFRPGIVHRLDKDTSGVIIAAYTEAALAFLAEQFKLRKTKKTYVAIVSGVPKNPRGRIETYIARDRGNRKRFAVADRGKQAITYYKVVKKWEGHSLLLLRPKTGRTHQLRVHLKFLGHPITGDALYGRKDPLFPDAALMLHAKRLAITLPPPGLGGENAASVFSAPLPERFVLMMRKLNHNARIARNAAGRRRDERN
jgi:23S rRNA pseudouridine1911/1915/1917 synthase